MTVATKGVLRFPLVRVLEVNSASNWHYGLNGLRSGTSAINCLGIWSRGSGRTGSIGVSSTGVKVRGAIIRGVSASICIAGIRIVCYCGFLRLRVSEMTGGWCWACSWWLFGCSVSEPAEGCQFPFAPAPKARPPAHGENKVYVGQKTIMSNRQTQVCRS